MNNTSSSSFSIIEFTIEYYIESTASKHLCSLVVKTLQKTQHQDQGHALVLMFRRL